MKKLKNKPIKIKSGIIDGDTSFTYQKGIQLKNQEQDLSISNNSALIQAIISALQGETIYTAVPYTNGLEVVYVSNVGSDYVYEVDLTSVNFLDITKHHTFRFNDGTQTILTEIEGLNGQSTLYVNGKEIFITWKTATSLELMYDSNSTISPTVFIDLIKQNNDSVLDEIDDLFVNMTSINVVQDTLFAWSEFMELKTSNLDIAGKVINTIDGQDIASKNYVDSNVPVLFNDNLLLRNPLLVTPAGTATNQEEVDIEYKGIVEGQGFSIATIEADIILLQTKTQFFSEFGTEWVYGATNTDAKITLSGGSTGIINIDSDIFNIKNQGILMIELTPASDDVKFKVPINMDSNKIINLDNPINETDATTKKYVDDNLQSGLPSGLTREIFDFTTTNPSHTLPANSRYEVGVVSGIVTSIDILNSEIQNAKEIRQFNTALNLTIFTFYSNNSPSSVTDPLSVITSATTILVTTVNTRPSNLGDNERVNQQYQSNTLLLDFGTSLLGNEHIILTRIISSTLATEIRTKMGLKENEPIVHTDKTKNIYKSTGGFIDEEIK